MTGGLEFGPGVLSPHPADVLMRELIATRRSATPDDVGAIVQRMASAPFDPRPARVKEVHRGLQLHGQTLGSRAPSLFYHLVKRVLLDQQWPVHTTEQQYLNDLHTAITAPSARHVVYFDRGGRLAAALVAAVSVEHPPQGLPGTLSWLLIVYSADRGCLLSGYQVTDLTTARIPSEALWLN